MQARVLQNLMFVMSGDASLQALEDHAVSSTHSVQASHLERIRRAFEVVFSSDGLSVLGPSVWEMENVYGDSLLQVALRRLEKPQFLWEQLPLLSETQVLHRANNGISVFERAIERFTSVADWRVFLERLPIKPFPLSFLMNRNPLTEETVFHSVCQHLKGERWREFLAMCEKPVPREALLAKDKKGETPLHCAMAELPYEDLEALLKEGGLILEPDLMEAKNKNAEGPLHFLLRRISPGKLMRAMHLNPVEHELCPYYFDHLELNDGIALDRVAPWILSHKQVLALLAYYPHPHRLSELPIEKETLPVPEETTISPLSRPRSGSEEFPPRTAELFSPLPLRRTQSSPFKNTATPPYSFCPSDAARA